jgi:hypothetical protein
LARNSTNFLNQGLEAYGNMDDCAMNSDGIIDVSDAVF